METAGPSETCSLWHKISVQNPMMPSVKGLHYALRIWTRQIFGLVIMMLYPLPPWNQVLHQAQCFCIPEMAHPTPPSATLCLLPYTSQIGRNTIYSPHCWDITVKEKKQMNREVSHCHHGIIKQMFLIILEDQY